MSQVGVYFVLSEELMDESGIYHDPPEAPENGCICEIVAAANRGRARWLLLKHEHLERMYPGDWPLLKVRRIGEIDREEGVLPEGEVRVWWAKCPDIKPPERKPYNPGFSQRDVAILGGDPSL